MHQEVNTQPQSLLWSRYLRGAATALCLTAVLGAAVVLLGGAAGMNQANAHLPAPGQRSVVEPPAVTPTTKPSGDLQANQDVEEVLLNHWTYTGRPKPSPGK